MRKKSFFYPNFEAFLKMKKKKNLNRSAYVIYKNNNEKPKQVALIFNSSSVFLLPTNFAIRTAVIAMWQSAKILQNILFGRKRKREFRKIVLYCWRKFIS